MIINVVVADDQRLMRSALRMCLSSEPDIEVVGEACDGREAILMVERVRLDAVIMGQGSLTQRLSARRREGAGRSPRRSEV